MQDSVERSYETVKKTHTINTTTTTINDRKKLNFFPNTPSSSNTNTPPSQPPAPSAFTPSAPPTPTYNANNLPKRPSFMVPQPIIVKDFTILSGSPPHMNQPSQMNSDRLHHSPETHTHYQPQIINQNYYPRKPEGHYLNINPFIKTQHTVPPNSVHSYFLPNYPPSHSPPLSRTSHSTNNIHFSPNAKVINHTRTPSRQIFENGIPGDNHIPPNPLQNFQIHDHNRLSNNPIIDENNQLREDIRRLLAQNDQLKNIIEDQKKSFNDFFNDMQTIKTETQYTYFEEIKRDPSSPNSKKNLNQAIKRMNEALDSYQVKLTNLEQISVHHELESDLGIENQFLKDKICMLEEKILQLQDENSRKAPNSTLQEQIFIELIEENKYLNEEMKTYLKEQSRQNSYNKSNENDDDMHSETAKNSELIQKYEYILNEHIQTMDEQEHEINNLKRLLIEATRDQGRARSEGDGSARQIELNSNEAELKILRQKLKNRESEIETYYDPFIQQLNEQVTRYLKENVTLGTTVEELKQNNRELKKRLIRDQNLDSQPPNNEDYHQPPNPIGLDSEFEWEKFDNKYSANTSQHEASEQYYLKQIDHFKEMHKEELNHNQKIIAELQEKIRELLNQNGQLNSESNNEQSYSPNVVQSLKEKNKRLQMELEELYIKQESDSRESDQRIIGSLKDQIKRLQQDLSEAYQNQNQTTNESQHRIILSLKEENRKLHQELEELYIKLDSGNKEGEQRVIIALRDKNRKLQQDFDEIYAKIEGQDTHYADLKIINSLKEKNQKLQAELDQLTILLEDASKLENEQKTNTILREQNRKLLQEIEQLKNQFEVLAEKDTEIQLLQQEKNFMKKKEAESSRVYDEMKDEINRLYGENESLKMQMESVKNDLQRYTSEVDRLQCQLESENIETSQIRKQFQTLEVQMSNDYDKFEEQENQITLLVVEIENLQNQIQKLKEEDLINKGQLENLDQIKYQNSGLIGCLDGYQRDAQDQNRKLNEKQKEVQDLKYQLSKAENDKDTLGNEIVKLVKMIKELKASKESIKSAYINLELSNEDLKQQYQQKKEFEFKFIEAQNHLRAQQNELVRLCREKDLKISELEEMLMNWKNEVESLRIDLDFLKNDNKGYQDLILSMKQTYTIFEPKISEICQKQKYEKLCQSSKLNYTYEKNASYYSKTN